MWFSGCTKESFINFQAVLSFPETSTIYQHGSYGNHGDNHSINPARDSRPTLLTMALSKALITALPA